MQLQIECNTCFSKEQSCYFCKQHFEMKEARVIVCDQQGEGYGEVCPYCIAKGFIWMKNQFQVQMTEAKPRYGFRTITDESDKRGNNSVESLIEI